MCIRDRCSKMRFIYIFGYRYSSFREEEPIQIPLWNFRCSRMSSLQGERLLGDKSGEVL